MSWIASHVVLMAIYALLTGAFFALLWRVETRDRVRLFAIVFFGMLLGGLGIAWAMFPFPG